MCLCTWCLVHAALWGHAAAAAAAAVLTVVRERHMQLCIENMGAMVNARL